MSGREGPPGREGVAGRGERPREIRPRGLLSAFAKATADEESNLNKHDMYVLIHPAAWPALPAEITEQAYLQLGVDEQVLYQACDQQVPNSDGEFFLDNGENIPGFGADPVI